MHQTESTEIRPDPAWSEWLESEFTTNRGNARFGTELVWDSERVRVWHLAVEPGERLPVHCHVLGYFWTTPTPARHARTTTTGAWSRPGTGRATPGIPSSGRASS
jgi:hypothetical protein